MTGAALGATVGGAVGAVYGTYESFAYKVEARRRYFLHAAVDADSPTPIITHARRLSPEPDVPLPPATHPRRSRVCWKWGT